MSNALIESLRAAISYAERAQNAELLGKFQKVLLEGQDVIDANLNLRQENQQLRDRVRELEAKLEFTENLEFISGLYHVVDSDGHIRDPYCPTCWESKSLAVHIHYKDYIDYCCNCCNTQFSYAKRNPDAARDEILAEPSSRPTRPPLAEMREKAARR